MMADLHNYHLHKVVDFLVLCVEASSLPQYTVLLLTKPLAMVL